VSAGAYLAGVAIFVATFGAAAIAAIRLRQRWLPGWSGAPAALATAVVGVALLLALAEALGTFGALRRIPFLAVCLACAAGAELWARRGPAVAGAAPAAATTRFGAGPLPLLVAGLTSAALVAQWSGRTLHAMANGMTSRDTLWYHLPFAARFVQSGEVGALPPNVIDPKVPFYPASSELLHALAMLPFHHEFAAGLVNLGALGLVLLAGWCIGRPWGVAPATLVAVAVPVATPIFLVSQPGNASNDAFSLAFLLAALALWLNGRDQPAAIACAGLAAGTAIATKLTVAVPVLLLTLVVILLAERRRGAVALAWLAALGVSSGYWFVRNLVAVGSPFPGVKLGVDGLALPHFSVTGTFAPKFADSIFDGHVWRTDFLPGLSVNFSRAWYALFALAALGLVAALAAGTRVQRAIAVMGATAAVAFVFTPTTGHGPFVFNARFLAVPLALGLLVIPLLAARRGERETTWTFAALAALALAVEVLAIRRRHLGAAGWELAGVAVAAGGVAAFALARVSRALLVGLGVAALALAGVGGWFLQRHDTRDRYAAARPPGETFSEADPGILRVDAWASRVRDARFAVAGYVETYPLFGVDLSNRVDYLEDLDRFHRQKRIRSCAEWRRRLRRGRYRYVVAAPTGYPLSPPDRRPEADWTRSIPGALELLRAGQLEVFELPRSIAAAGCPT
jgi:hypothetical protein